VRSTPGINGADSGG